MNSLTITVTEISPMPKAPFYLVSLRLAGGTPIHLRDLRSIGEVHSCGEDLLESTMAWAICHGIPLVNVGQTLVLPPKTPESQNQ